MTIKILRNQFFLTGAALFFIFTYSGNAKIRPSSWVWVSISDKGKSCEKSTPIEETGTLLKQANIRYKKAKKIISPNLHIQMCGAEKGDLNAYLIQKKDVEKANSLGFDLVKNKL